MGLFTQRVEKSDLVAGDHIYTWRAAFTYSHHGIYVGGNQVVHFTSDENVGPSCGSYFSSSVPSSVSGSEVPATCPNLSNCGFRQPKSGVGLTCLDCFLGDGSLYRFEYGVTRTIFLTNRGGTCTTDKSDPPETVIHRALYLLQSGFGNYDVLKNNCEDFALYCKTGLLILEKKGLGRSGQVASVVNATKAALLLSSPVSLVMTTAAYYCKRRYAADLGVQTDIKKVPVEEVHSFYVQKGQN